MADAMSWAATDLLGLGQELQQKIRQLSLDVQRAHATAQTSEDHDAAEEKATKEKEAIEAAFRERVATLQGTDGSATVLYDKKLADIDMDRLVYSGDRAGLVTLLTDPRFAFSLNQAISERRPFNARKELLTRGLKLTRTVAPMVHEVVARCASALKMTANIEVYVYHEALYNAACYPPRKDKVLLMLTSSLLDNFTEDELAFVIGHELGHYLFEHTRFPMESVLGYINPTPLDAMRIYAWKRCAEFTADRAGMVCCRNFPAAASSFFKLSCGVTGSRVKFSLDDYLKQLNELEGELSKDDDPEAWYSTHPFSPLRIKALDVFVRSKTYHELIGQKPPKGSVSDDKTEKALAELLAMMEPSWLSGDTDVKAKARRFAMSAGYYIARINGVVDDREKEALLQVMGEEADPKQLEEYAGMEHGKLKTEVEKLAKELQHLLDMGPRMQMIQDLTIITYADGELEDSELACLYDLADRLEIPQHFVDNVVVNAHHGVD